MKVYPIVDFSVEEIDRIFVDVLESQGWKADKEKNKFCMLGMCTDGKQRKLLLDFTKDFRPENLISMEAIEKLSIVHGVCVDWLYSRQVFYVDPFEDFATRMNNIIHLVLFCHHHSVKERVIFRVNDKGMWTIKLNKKQIQDIQNNLPLMVE